MNPNECSRCYAYRWYFRKLEELERDHIEEARRFRSKWKNIHFVDGNPTSIKRYQKLERGAKRLQKANIQLRFALADIQEDDHPEEIHGIEPLD